MSSLLASAAVFPPLDMPLEIALQRVLNEKDAATFIGVSAVTLERLRKVGAAPKHLMLSPRRLGYRVGDLMKWLDKRAAAGDEAAQSMSREGRIAGGLGRGTPAREGLEHYTRDRANPPAAAITAERLAELQAILAGRSKTPATERRAVILGKARS
jgi:predicted DNA-binding transcriptional regulator AlpA